VSVNASGSYALLINAETEDTLLAQFVAAADQASIHPGNPGNERFCAIAARASPPREISGLIPLVRHSGSAGPALQSRAASPERTAQEAIRLGANELSLYNYALLRERETPAFVAAVRRGFT
jgi:hypothetical protein